MITAYEYYNHVAKPAVDEFQKENGSLKLALSASMALLHVVDYVMQNRESDPKEADEAVRRYVERTSQNRFAFRVVKEFALASKHCRLRADGFHSGEYMRAYASFAGVMRCGQSFLGDAIGGITVRWREQQYVNLTTVLSKTLEIYESDFPELNFRPGQPALDPRVQENPFSAASSS
jgi:hypothetical protein